MSEFLTVAARVLLEKQVPMRAREITQFALDHGLFSDRISGCTPHQTLKSKICQHIRKEGNDSIFVRTEPGRFYLRALMNPADSVYNAPPLTKPEPREDVLVLPVSLLDPGDRFQGISKSWKAFFRRYLSTDNCCYLPRMDAERVLTHKQILTYVMLTRGNELLAYKRGSWHRAGDFLKGVHCVGFGGHVTVDDSVVWSNSLGIRECAIRELSEELELPKADLGRLADESLLKIVGLLNDDSSQVGQRHLAVLFKYEVSDDPKWDNPTRGEKAVTQLRWISPFTEIPHITEFEYWSQLCIREFFYPLIERKAVYKIIRHYPFSGKHILCVIGQIGSGKSEASRVFAEEYGYSIVNSGKVLAQAMGIPPIPVTPRGQFQELAENFIRAESGPQCLAESILKEIEDAKSDRVLVDGIRQQQTLAKLRSMIRGRNLAILYVHTPADQAFDFYRNREANDASIENFLEVRSSPVELEVSEMIHDADAVLYNWRGRASYQAAVRILMSDLNISPERVRSE